MAYNFRKMNVIYMPDSDGPAKEGFNWAVYCRIIDENTVKQRDPSLIWPEGYANSIVRRRAFIGVN